jgi:peptide/nickel transport system substrate-binding protein
MNRLDRVIVAGLVIVIAIAAVAVGGQALLPKPGASATTSSSPAVAGPVVYREGVLGRPTAVNPLAARTQADRDLVALTFEGLLSMDASGQPRPALARSWETSPDGATWTFHLRPDATWQDGEPVTSDDVLFTVATLQDPDYHGPGAGSWSGVNVTAVDERTVRFDLDPPLAGFAVLATQPIAPQHLLGDTPVAELPDDPFGSQPIGSGPYAVVELDRDHAVLEPASAVSTPAVGGDASSAPSLDPLATVRPSARDAAPEPSIDRIELRFFDDEDSLAGAFRHDDLDAASGLDPAAASALADVPGSRLLREPSTTLVAIALNLRPSHPELSDVRTRKALLEAIDRDRLVAVAYGGLATRADGLIPPSSWAFDAADTPGIPHDEAAAVAALKKAGWTRKTDGWHAGGAKDPETLQLAFPTSDSNPILAAVGSQVAADWQALGFHVDVIQEDAATIAADRLRTGDYTAALVSIEVGHDPDLYPLLASSQTRTGGANIFGVQDPDLDSLLEAARQPNADPARIAAFAEVQKRLNAQAYVLPVAWPDTVVALGKRVDGTSIRTVADGSERFRDVLDWRLADDR